MKKYKIVYDINTCPDEISFEDLFTIADKTGFVIYDGNKVKSTSMIPHVYSSDENIALIDINSSEYANIVRNKVSTILQNNDKQ